MLEEGWTKLRALKDEAREHEIGMERRKEELARLVREQKTLEEDVDSIQDKLSTVEAQAKLGT